MHLSRAAAPLLIAALVAACSSTGASPAPTAAQASVAPASAAPASMAPASSAPSSSAAAGSAAQSGGSGYDAYSKGSGSSQAAAGGGIAVVTTTLGSVLAGPTGMTLYMFTPDTSTTSACTGQCAANWPALTGALPSLGSGLDASHFGSISRPDGTKQVTFYGHPLYYFAGDQAAGDTKGQGLSGKWYVLGADGNPIK